MTHGNLNYQHFCKQEQPTNYFANNYIDVSSSGSNDVYGLYINQNNSPVTIAHNSINHTAFAGSAMYVENDISAGLKVKNNILYTSGGGIPLKAVTQSNVDWDYNCYYNNVGNTLASYNGNNYSSVSALGTVLGSDANSLNLNPFYVSNTNLMVSQRQLNGAGIYVPGCNVDIDNDLDKDLLTDNKEYFNQCTRKNLIVNELQDFYSEYPEIEPYEKFYTGMTAEEHYNYITMNLGAGSKFSFSVYRFNLIQAQRLGITNVAMMCVDSCFSFKRMVEMNVLGKTFNHMFSCKNKLYNAVAIYGTTKNHCSQLELTWKTLKEKYNYETTDEIVPTPDAAARLFIFESEEQMMKLFTIWNEMVVHLYETKQIGLYEGSRVINDEFLLGPIYHMVGINQFLSLIHI